MLNDELTSDSIERMKRQMTGPQWEKIYEMNRDRSLYQNLINSLFPSIHGNDQIKKGCKYIIHNYFDLYYIIILISRCVINAIWRSS